MLPLIFFCLATLVSAYEDGTVLTTPKVVHAGEPFTIFTNLTAASWPNPDCQGPGRCDMKYLRVYLMSDPTYETMTDRTGRLIIWRRYLEGCVSTNLINFNTSIPKGSFPDGYPYSLDYMLFTPLDNGSISGYTPTFAAFSATIFNLTGATGNWSEFEYESSDYGIEEYVSTMPCSAVPCLEECQTKFVAPYVPFPRKKGEELDACVEEDNDHENIGSDGDSHYYLY
ncbi:hypothetical protein G7Z17_g3407 [Cylindrodendrum hubeiense]|uniref:Uncharacterized protein n=1 Tax=Cylindrodendrum hubeiense TaxID=595255 RepID=A0A9P5HH12_9HYPO|nr:hypothetical protein G7Z17_g3407 [Cylindrodendrum hubeiense]